LLIQLCMAVGLAILISTICSVLEAALYSVPNSHLEILRKKGSRSALIMKG